MIYPLSGLVNPDRIDTVNIIYGIMFAYIFNKDFYLSFKKRGKKMGLKITLKPNEKMIVGNAVISNSGHSDCYISVENNSTILREKNIMCEEDAKTPCQQLYFIIQLMYIDSENVSIHQKTFWKFSKDIVKAAPSTYNIIDEINLHITNQNYYKALKAAQNLIDYETELMTSFISGSLRNMNTQSIAAL